MRKITPVKHCDPSVQRSVASELFREMQSSENLINLYNTGLRTNKRIKAGLINYHQITRLRKLYRAVHWHLTQQNK